MTNVVEDFLTKRFIKLKGWDKFGEDMLSFGSIVTDKKGNRVDPKELTPPPQP